MGVAFDAHAGEDDDLAEGAILDPAHIAEQFWTLHVQPRDAWTFELDLRPWTESW